MGKVKIDWLLAEQEYLADRRKSLEDISIKYGVSLSRTKKVAARNRWQEKRDSVWKEAETKALEETVCSAKRLIERHAYTAQFMQREGIRLLKDYLGSLSRSDYDPSLIIRMITEGLKAERSLYADSLIIKEQQKESEAEQEHFSPELLEAVHEVFVKKLGRKRPRLWAFTKQKTRVGESPYYQATSNSANS